MLTISLRTAVVLLIASIVQFHRVSRATARPAVTRHSSMSVQRPRSQPAALLVRQDNSLTRSECWERLVHLTQPWRTRDDVVHEAKRAKESQSMKTKEESTNV